MLSEMITSVKNAEIKASVIISDAQSVAVEMRADAQRKAEKMKLYARQNAESETDSAIESLKISQTAVDRKEAKNTEMMIQRLEENAKKHRKALNEKLTEIIFS